MKKAFSALELLIILVVLCAFVLMFGPKSNPVQTAVKERAELNKKIESVNQQLDGLQKIRDNQDKQIQNSLEYNY